MAEQVLKGKVAVVAGATRGAGRGIAVELGAAGATVYCTGRSTRGNPSDMNRPETIEETAELVNRAGGTGIAVRTDHTVPSEVEALFKQVKKEQEGRLDILVNDIGAEGMIDWKMPLWESDVAQDWAFIERAIYTHIVTSRYGLPLMLAENSGLIIEVTDGETYDYRGNFFYDLGKVGVMRLAHNQAKELKDTNITAVALTPGFLRSEMMLEHFGVTEETWRDAAKQDPYFAESETPYYIGRAVVALATDPNVHEKAGQTLSTWHLSDEYGFEDIDGRQPHWKRFFDKMQADEQSS